MCEHVACGMWHVHASQYSKSMHACVRVSRRRGPAVQHHACVCPVEQHHACVSVQLEVELQVQYSNTVVEVQ